MYDLKPQAQTHYIRPRPRILLQITWCALLLKDREPKPRNIRNKRFHEGTISTRVRHAGTAYKVTGWRQEFDVPQQLWDEGFDRLNVDSEDLARVKPNLLAEAADFIQMQRAPELGQTRLQLLDGDEAFKRK